MLTKAFTRRLRKLESVTFRVTEKLDLTIVFVVGDGTIGRTLKLGAGPNGEDLWEKHRD